MVSRHAFPRFIGFLILGLVLTLPGWAAPNAAAISMAVVANTMFVVPPFPPPSVNIDTQEDVDPLMVSLAWVSTGMFKTWDDYINAGPTMDSHVILDAGQIADLKNLYQPYWIVPMPDANSFLMSYFRVNSGFCAPGPGGCSNPAHGASNHAILWGVNSNPWPHKVETNEPREERLFPNLLGPWPYIISGDGWAAAAQDRLDQTRHMCATCNKCPDEDPCPVVPVTTTDPVTGLTTTNDEKQHCNGGAGRPCYNLQPLDNDRKGPDCGIALHGPPVPGWLSGRQLTIKFKDRTPPKILDLGGNQIAGSLPPMCAPPGEKPATTGDYNKAVGIKLDDNFSDKIYSLFGILRVDPLSPVGSWSWTTTPPTPTESNRGDQPGYVFIPSDCLGIGKYTIFCWDKDKNLNPGQSPVNEDSPTDSYNVGYGPKPKKNLGKNPISAEEFHLKYPADAVIIESDVKTGDLYVDDNDAPNLMIKLINTRDKASMGNTKYAFCFPLPVPDTPTLWPDKLAEAFEGAALDYDHYQNVATVGAAFRLLAIDFSNAMSAATNNGEFQAGPTRAVASEGFFRGALRLEDFMKSDTDTSAQPILDEPSTMGARNGTGRSVTVFQNDPLIEDIEYELWIYAEDNVKMTKNPTAVRPSCMVGDIPTSVSGIDRVEILVDDRMQLPPWRFGTTIGSAQARGSVLHGPYKMIFREPTPDPSGSAETALIANRNPMINVKAFDFAGNLREIKMYFRVMDQKAAARVLEQRLPKQ